MTDNKLISITAQQGNRLDRISGVSDSLSKKLFDLGITHAAQFLGTSSVEDVRPHLAAQLGITADKLTQTITRVRNATPDTVASMFEGTAFSLPALGALIPGDALKAKIASLPASAAGDVADLPSFVNLASDFGPIRNQAFRGTCTAFAMTALHEYYQKIIDDPEDLSEEYLYQLQKALDRVDPADNPRDPDTSQNGSWLISASEVLRRFGQCLESTDEYNPGTSEADTNVFRPRPPGSDEEAAKYKLATRMLNPNDAPGIRAALAGGSPVPVSFPVYNSWFQAPDTIRTGRITMPIDGEPQVGGHAVCLVGYKDDGNMPGGGYFILRNSWQRVGLELGGVASSVLWAQESQFGTGYGTMPYAYMTKLGQEAYALVTVPGRTPLDSQQAGNSDTANVLDFLSLPAEPSGSGSGSGGASRPADRPAPGPAGPATPGVAPAAPKEKPERIVIVRNDGTRIIIG